MSMTAEAIRTIGIRDLDHAAKRATLAREFLVTNGLGGYASGTLGGLLTRRYHTLLTAALPAPLGRVVLVSRLDERVRPQRLEQLFRSYQPSDVID